MSTSISNYWRVTRAPRYSLTFALPLLLAYEVLAFSLSHDEVTGVRNGADVLLKSLFLALGGRTGLVVFGALLVGGGAWMVGQDYRRWGSLDPRVFGLMMVESVAYALGFGLVTGRLTGLLLPGLSIPWTGSASSWSLPTQLMISLGAGIYEELLFRVILVSGLALIARRALGWSPTGSGVLAVVVGALIFSAFHYVGPYGDRFDLISFTFRAIAGVLFSSLYLLRGFGITAWTHALYDVFLAVGR
jgi:membrane protease YdiL (CAAX protease family)